MAGSGSGNKNLLVPNKNAPDAHKGYATDMRSIEQWASNLPGSGTITEITSNDNTVTITNPFGPVVDLSVAGGFVPYASLLGAGEFSTPGDLTQTGNFIIDGAHDLFTATILNVGSGLTVQDTSGSGLNLLGTTGSAGVGSVSISNNLQSIALGSVELILNAGSGSSTCPIVFVANDPGYGIVLSTTRSGFSSDAVQVFAAPTIGTLPTPASGTIAPNRAFGFTEDGHIGYYNGSVWSTLV